jgi:hypothetical protein
MRLVDTVKDAWHDDTTVPAQAAGETAPMAAAEGTRAVLTFRRSIAALALALPPLITLVDLFLPDVHWHVRGSLSAYYFGGSREIFTGGLTATGALLIAFKAMDRRLEFWLTFAAGVLAIFVGFFPTTSCESCGASTPLQTAIGADIVRDIHYASAFTMIGLLAVTCVMWAVLERHTGVGSERYRWLHIASAVVILIAVVFGVLMKFTSPIFDQELLVVEWVSVWAFALSWLFIGPAYKTREAARAAR